MTEVQYRPQCPKCNADQPDSLLCAACSDRLKSQLLALPGLLHELHVTNSGLGRMGGSGKRTELPLLFDPDSTAARVSDEARMTLLTWTKELDFGDTEHLANNPRAWALWLADRIERIRGHAAAEEIADTIDYTTRQIKMAIDRPADQEFFGRCAVCEADLYAPHGSVEGYCRKCKAEGVTTTYDPAANRAEIQSQVEERLGTANECAKILALFGLEVSLKTIKHWAWKDKHGVIKLEKRGENHLGHPMYSFGQVMDLSRERVEKRKRGQAA